MLCIRPCDWAVQARVTVRCVARSVDLHRCSFSNETLGVEREIWRDLVDSEMTRRQTKYM